MYSKRLLQSLALLTAIQSQQASASCGVSPEYAFDGSSSFEPGKQQYAGNYHPAATFGGCKMHNMVCSFGFSNNHTSTLDHHGSCSIGNSASSESIACGNLSLPNYYPGVDYSPSQSYNANTGSISGMLANIVSTGNSVNWDVVDPTKPAFEINGPTAMTCMPTAMELNPPNPSLSVDTDTKDACTSPGALGSAKYGSIIDCRSRNLSQDIPITGTPFSLHYSARRNYVSSNPTYTITAAVPLYSNPYSSGDVWKPNKVRMEWSIAGKTYYQEVSYTDFENNHSGGWENTFVWDGKNNSNVTVGLPATGSFKVIWFYDHGWNPAGSAVQMYRESAVTVGSILTVPAAQLGQWEISDFHKFDPASEIVYLGSGNKIERSETSWTKITDSNGDHHVPSADASLIYKFSSTGLHLSTRDAITGVVIYTFQYSSGRLSSITDRDGLVTTINRNGSYQITSIVSPYSKTTSISYDGSGRISQIQNPLSQTTSFTYYSNGLMETMTDALSKTKTYYYDGDGYLTSAENRRGLTKTLTKVGDYVYGSMYWAESVVHSSPMGRDTTYDTIQTETGTTLVNTFPSGFSVTQSENIFGRSQTTTDNNGGNVTQTMKEDARFPGRMAVTEIADGGTGGGVTSRNSAFTLVALPDPFTLATYTTTTTLGSNAYVSTYDSSADTITEVSPLNRQTVKTLDAKGRIVSEQFAALHPIEYTYNSSGQLTAIEQGSRTYAFTYNSNGELSSVENPLSETTSYTYDALGRVTQETLPNTKTYLYGYNANGQLNSITNAASNAYSYGFDDNENTTVNTEPSVSSTSYGWGWAYNNDDQLTTTTQADATSVTRSYNSQGLVSSVSGPDLSRTYSYDSNGRLNEIASPSSRLLSFQGDRLPSLTTWSGGGISGSVGYSWGSFGKLDNFTINGSDSVYFSYDSDEALYLAEGLSYTRGSATGFIDATSVGLVSTAHTYSSYGEESQTEVTNNGSTLLTLDYVRDDLGRITQITKTTSGGSTQTDYTYDSIGQLSSETTASVTKNYTYTDNGNRLTSGGSEVYDSHDRLTSDAIWTYTYNKNGHLTRKDHVSNGSYVLYSYDAAGNLFKVEYSTGNVIDYVIDGMDRRIQRKLNTAFSANYIYLDNLRPAAQLNSNGSIHAIFVYGSRTNSPDLVIKSAVTYRIIHDHLGSPLYVIREDTGAIAQQITYDTWGKVLSDSNPGFQPFGFAGGLYDQTTGLLRFGARDYDPTIGRWLNKDPIRHEGGMNLYAYVGSDPVNFIDPDGLQSVRAVGGTIAAGTWIAGVIRGLCGQSESVMFKKKKPKQPQPPTKGPANGSITVNDIDTGLPNQTRYYDENGHPERDIDFGHPHHHPEIEGPHEHRWEPGGDPDGPGGKKRGEGRPLQPGATK